MIINKEAKFSLEVFVPGELAHTRKQRADFVRIWLRQILELPDYLLVSKENKVFDNSTQSGVTRWE